MGWLNDNHLMDFVSTRYRNGEIFPMSVVFYEVCHAKEDPITSEKNAFAIIVSGEAFAAVSDFPSDEVISAKLGERPILYERTMSNVDKFALQSLDLLENSKLMKSEWASDLADLRSRLNKISAKWEDHRLNPERGVVTED